MKRLILLDQVTGGYGWVSRTTLYDPPLMKSTTKKITVTIIGNDYYDFEYNGSTYKLTRTIEDPTCQFRLLPCAYLYAKSTYTTSQDDVNSPGYTRYVIFL